MTEQNARERWFPVADPLTPEQARKHRMADHVRDLISDVLFLDALAADDKAFAEAEALLAQARAAVAALPDIPDRNLHIAPVDNNHSERSPLTGRSNALAAPLTMWFDGDLTYGEATYADRYEGPPGMVHGGYVIAAFDDMLGVAQSASGMAGFTGTLSVKLLHGTPLNRLISYEAGVSGTEGRKVFAWGRSTLDGVVIAEATGIFIEPKGGHPVRAMREAAGLPFLSRLPADS